jgi:hypothetical protein
MLGTADLDDATIKHLELLNEKMSEVSKESNSFATKFQFGGIVAVIALLNTDLIIDKRFSLVNVNPYLAAGLLLLILVLSGMYFRGAADRIRHFRRAYRSTKHKYEVTLYTLLLTSPADKAATLNFISNLEHSLKESGIANPELSPTSTYEDVMEYLHKHHAEAYNKIPMWKDWWLAMSIVLFTVIIKIGFYLL